MAPLYDAEAKIDQDGIQDGPLPLESIEGGKIDGPGMAMELSPEIPGGPAAAPGNAKIEGENLPPAPKKPRGKIVPRGKVISITERKTKGEKPPSANFAPGGKKAKTEGGNIGKTQGGKVNFAPGGKIPKTFDTEEVERSSTGVRIRRVFWERSVNPETGRTNKKRIGRTYAGHKSAEALEFILSLPADVQAQAIRSAADWYLSKKEASNEQAIAV